MCSGRSSDQRGGHWQQLDAWSCFYRSGVRFEMILVAGSGGMVPRCQFQFTSRWGASCWGMVGGSNVVLM